jgi:peroxiredoxin
MLVQSYHEKRRKKKPISGKALFFSGLIAIVILLSGFIWLLFQPSKGTVPTGGIGIGQAAPNFTLPDENGHPITLRSFRGQPTIINFWASYCAPCQDETLLLQRFYEDHQSQKLVILGINEGEPMSTITQFVQQYELTYPVISDRTLQFNDSSSYDPVPLPRTYFIDKQGIVQALFTGELNAETLQADYEIISR